MSQTEPQWANVLSHDPEEVHALWSAVAKADLWGIHGEHVMGLFEGAEHIPTVSLPQSARDGWEITRFFIGEQEARVANMRCLLNRHRTPRWVTPGVYTSLRCGEQVWMSDTLCERVDHYLPWLTYEGDVLITGLGLGVFSQALLLKHTIDRVVVLESSQAVIDLVAPHYQRVFPTRLEVVHADAFTWENPQGWEFDHVWHDIWPSIDTDNLCEMRALINRYGQWSRNLPEAWLFDDLELVEAEEYQW